MLAYHFTSNTLRDGSPIPVVGEWLEYDGVVIICQTGLHASLDPFDALQYAPGNLLHLVEVEDIVEQHTDKFVCRRRKIIKTIDSEIINREFSRWCALSVINLWEAPQVVVEYLETGREELRAAAWEAAWAAARAAAWEAARAAAGEAARNAAWAAAWAAVGAAAWEAARNVVRNAVGAAAWAAARAAAGEAARDTARKAQRNKYQELINKRLEGVNHV